MKTEVQHESNSTIVTVTGSVDALTAAELSNALSEQIAAGHANLVVDLIDVEFMSSAGLRALLGAVKAARSSGGEYACTSGASAGAFKSPTSSTGGSVSSSLAMCCVICSAAARRAGWLW